MLDKHFIRQALEAREAFCDIQWLCDYSPQLRELGETATPAQTELADALLALVGPLTRAQEAAKAWEREYFDNYHAPEEIE